MAEPETVVERLRSQSAALDAECNAYPADLMTEAADLISALQLRVGELQEAAAHASDFFARYAADEADDPEICLNAEHHSMLKSVVTELDRALNGREKT